MPERPLEREQAVQRQVGVGPREHDERNVRVVLPRLRKSGS